MKGGKAGRKRRSSATDAGKQNNGRGPAKPAKVHREGNVAPRKGSRKKNYGGIPTRED